MASLTAAGARVLDGGCGTGRVAAELARRNRIVVGVDNDPDLLGYARRRPEPVRWELADLATMDLLRAGAQAFDAAVLAGEVLPFVEPSSRAAVIGNLARHLRPGGLLIIGSGETGDCRHDDIDRWCAAAGLELEAAYATWDGRPPDGGRYRVSVHRALSGRPLG